MWDFPEFGTVNHVFVFDNFSSLRYFAIKIQDKKYSSEYWNLSELAKQKLFLLIVSYNKIIFILVYLLSFIQTKLNINKTTETNQYFRSLFLEKS